ncbi:hypothetical protein [Pseudomonas aeruginosa]|uniref:PA0613 family protein n=1 Tax=Pseudomonas aeruginosa TaxID=287 RepID=UPI0017A9C2B8
MIPAIDEMLKEWADSLHGGAFDSGSGAAGANVIARLIDTRGSLIRSTNRGYCPWDRTADIELIVNKRLPDDLAHVVRLHYLDRDMCDSLRWEAAGCGQRQFYRRLDLAHAAIAEILMRRAA